MKLEAYNGDCIAERPDIEKTNTLDSLMYSVTKAG
jgi:hypothetical protein